ncbi:YidB family protein [Ochrobactrum sp. GPK 3]|uniref:YidB family protein n=1 Tax=Brucella sp. 22210 TaxID=3453892 RepID=UPI0031385AFF
MGSYDDNSNGSPIPGGSLAKPIMIALGALLVGKMLGGSKEEPAPTQAQPVPDQSQAGGGLGGLLGGLLGGGAAGNASPTAANEAGGGLLGGILGGLGGLLGGAAAGNASAAPSAPGPLSGGLGGLLEQLNQAGLGDKVESWVGQGQNHSIEPGQLGDAIGQKTLSEIAQHAGIDQQELLNQLSQVLPGLVDKLTANGQVPDTNALSKLLQGR